MIEETIGTYLANNSSLVKGTSLFLSEIPQDSREGVAIRTVRETLSFGEFDKTNLIVIIFKKSYPLARELAKIIGNLFNDHRGTVDGTWTISDKVELEDFQKDEFGRYIFVVMTKIAYT